MPTFVTLSRSYEASNPTDDVSLTRSDTVSEFRTNPYASQSLTLSKGGIRPNSVASNGAFVQDVWLLIVCAPFLCPPPTKLRNCLFTQTKKESR